jgi:hypothetical protein
MDIYVQSKLEQTPVNQADIIFIKHKDLTINPSSGKTDSNGTFSCTITAPTVVATTLTTVYINATKVGYIYNLSQVIFTIKPKIVEKKKIDLHITEDDISLSQTTFQEGDVITISVNISNIGNLNASNINVRFSVNDVQLGAVEQVVKLDKNKYIIVSKTWTAMAGNQTIKVELIPSDSSLELNNSDNAAETKIFVSEKEKPVNEPEKPKKEDNSLMALLIFVIPIIVIILICFLVIILVSRKRKSKPVDYYEITQEEETGQVPQPVDGTAPGPEPGYEPTNEPISTSESPEQPVEDLSESGEPIYTEETGTETIPTEELDTEQLEPTQDTAATGDLETLDEHYIPPPPSELPPPTEGITATEPITELEAEQSTQDPVLKDSGPQEQRELDNSDQQGQQDLEMEMEMVACPICKNQIPIYSTPCPSCNSELNWN